MPPLNTFDELLREAHHLHRGGRFEDAARFYRELLRLKPNNAALTGLFGLLRREQGRREEAERLLDKACRLDPANVSNHVYRGLTLNELGRAKDAIVAFEQAYALDPTYPYVLSELWQASLSICDWRHFERYVRAMGDTAGNGKAVMEPYALLLATDDAADLLACARTRVADSVKQNQQLFPRSPYVHAQAQGRGKIRVAYRSADFLDHPTAHLIGELIEQHDRSRFEIIALSMGQSDGSAYRKRLEAAFDRFIDVLDWPINEVSQKIHSLDIDILVDLMGHTRFGLMHYLASRPAKIQVNYLGYPGSTGADFIDYIVADPFVIPADQDAFFSEKAVRLPDSYQVNDRGRPSGDPSKSRAQCGLPESGFVFCSFNNAFKLTPPIFDVWMRLLRAVADSVLWLLDQGEAAAGNLRKEAVQRGVDAGRLVFAPKMPLADHMARYRLADLSLDTLPYNAHTTASDSLWAGVPIITCPGRSFAARVCGSLLLAAGLPELIVRSLDEYEALALALAHDRERLAALRRKIVAGRDRMPLFDTPRYCAHIERAYETMYEIWLAGEPPRSFAVEPMAAD